MPFYVHAIGSEPESGTPYTVRAEAFQAKTDGQTITFVCSEDERYQWKERERGRFESGEYARVPWAESEIGTDWMHECRFHFVHLSKDKLGLVAYTPDDEYGVQDRQVRLKPGAYLSRFASGLQPSEIDDYCARVKSFSWTFQIARTTDEIVKVYRNGPSSCMDKRHEQRGNFNTGGIHPCSVYGESDLAVAYLGTLDDVTARCVIWPDETIYTRVYGDTTLEHLLGAAGYSQGTLSGAKIRRIETRHGALVMPYIDGADGASWHSRDYMILSDDDSDYSVKRTDGLAEEATVACEHCGRDFTPDDDETLCDDCDNDRFYCDECDTDYFGDDTTSHYLENARRTVCDGCYSNLETECELCDERWIETERFSRCERDERQRLHVTGLCADCASEHRYCDGCDTYQDIDTNPCPDCGHAVRCPETADLLASVETVPTVAPVDTEAF